MSLLDNLTDTTTPAQRVANRIKENVRIAARMLLQTYAVGYSDLWYSTTNDNVGASTRIDPKDIMAALGTDAAQVLGLTQIIGQLWPAELLNVPDGYTYAVHPDGTITLTYTQPSSSSSVSSASSESSDDSSHSSHSSESSVSSDETVTG